MPIARVVYLLRISTRLSGTGAAEEIGRGPGEIHRQPATRVGAVDGGYRAVFDSGRFADALRQFEADLIMISAGFDA